MKKSIWWENAVIYQIYPLSFYDSNGDGYGDIKGVIQKLDYLNDDTDKSLGIHAVWLSPIYKTAFKDWGYDVIDHCDVDPRFGTMQDFEELVVEAHKRGIKIVLDYVVNHTSDKHPWFIQSRNSRENPKRDWYIWKDAKADGSPPNNWISSFGGSAWEFDKKTEQYYLHSFLKGQPDLNWRNPEVEEAMLNVLKFWIGKGVDGFRIDAFSHLMKDKDFRDEPKNTKYRQGKGNSFEALVHKYTIGTKELEGKIKGICKFMEKYDSTLLIGEMHGLDAYELVRYQKLCSKNRFIPLNFNFIDLLWDSVSYRKFINEYKKLLGSERIANWVLGNHDQHRVASRIGEEQTRLAAMLVMTLGGMTFIYNGEEIGMEDTNIPKKDIKDPWEKQVPGKGLGRDPERTPMQWDGSKNAGFNKDKTWLPINRNYKRVNVEEEQKKSNSMLNLYKQLIRLKKASSALGSGKYAPLKTSNKQVLAFARKSKGETIYAVFNFSKKPLIVSMGSNKKKVKQILSTHQIGEKPNDNLKAVKLKSHEGVLLVEPHR